MAPEDFTEPEEFDGVLDMTGADESAGSFVAFAAGNYNAHVADVEWRRTKADPGPNAKLPGNTPFLNISFAIDDDEDSEGMKIKNRRVFYKVFVAPESHEKVSYWRGIMLNTLLALDYDRKDIEKKGFKIDLEDMKGRTCVVSVSRSPNDYKGGELDNDVRGIKPAGEPVAAGGGLV